MLDINFIRDNPDFVKKSLKKRKVNPKDIDGLLVLDQERRKIIKDCDQKRHQQNKITQEIKRTRDQQKRISLVKRSKFLKQEIAQQEKKLKDVLEKIEQIMLKLPNLPLSCVPEGKDETENVILRQVGRKPEFNFQPRSHIEIGKNLGLIDKERAAKVAGSRFGYFLGQFVLMEFALLRYLLKSLIKEGFEPILPPLMIRPQIAQRMGHVEQVDEQEAYYLPKDDLYLVGTSEQTIGSMHANEVFDEKDLPKRYLGFSTCFRREAGSYGKDTEGVFRVHQFDKAEMFIFCKPEQAEKEHQFLLEIEERLMGKLGLPYQVVEVCTGDMGKAAARQYDIETWFPSQNRYRETHSCSNCTDFQSRGLNIKYKDKNNGLRFVATLNGTAFTQRLLLAVIENYQRKDGSFKVPDVLKL